MMMGIFMMPFSLLQVVHATPILFQAPILPRSGEYAMSGEMPNNLPSKEWENVQIEPFTRHATVLLNQVVTDPARPVIYISGVVRHQKDKNIWVQIDKITKNGSHLLTWDYPIPINSGGQFSEWIHLPFGEGDYEVEAAPPLTTNKTRLFYHFDTQEESKSYRFHITYTHSDSNQQIGMLTSVWANWTDPKIKKLAEQITNKAKTSMAKAFAVYQWEANHINYNWSEISLTSSYRWSTAEETLANRRGVCVDYSNVADALMRAVGIPTQMLVGYANDSTTSFADNGNLEHCWNRSWIGGRWVYWDPTWSREYMFSESDYITQTQWFNPPMTLLHRTHQMKFIAMQ